MAKDNKQKNARERRSRKEILLNRRRERQNRQVRIAVGAVVGLLVLVFAVAIVNEYFLIPNRPVASVNGVEIPLEAWQDRVRYQRAQFIVAMEDQLETFGDMSLVQQFNQQQISLLLEPETLGELVLEQMVEEELIRQAAIQRAIRVSEEEVDGRIQEQFNFFGGASPTLVPTPTGTIMPTPSLTPIPTEVITQAVPTNTPFPTPTQGPTSTPRPTATPVTEEAYQEEYGTFLDRYREMGVSEETFRSVVRAQLFREKLTEQLAEVENVPDEAEMASVYLLAFETEEAATTTLAELGDEPFLTAWNRIRSTPADPENPASVNASEALWQTQEQLGQSYGEAVATAAFELPLNETSDVLQRAESVAADGTAQPERFYLIQVSGREVRPLSEAEIRRREQQVLDELVTAQRGLAAIEQFPTWRSRVPTQPVLDPAFLQQQPTPAPQIPQPQPTVPPTTE